MAQGWQQEGPAVFRARFSPLAVNTTDIHFLESHLPDSHLRRVRLCSHWSDEETLHEMIIVMERDSYVRPHRHSAKSESFHMVDGEMDVVIFDETGAIKHIVPLGKYGTERNFYYRLAAGTFHSIVIHSPRVVFQEITTGPFRKEQTEYAGWSPAESDPAAVAEFRRQLCAQVVHRNPVSPVRG